jgi:excinuclease ABC subunit A
MRGRAPASEADARPGFSFQYKGLFPAIEEAGRVSFVYRYKLQGMVDDVPCAGCMGARLRDDAAAVRFQGFTLDQISRWPLDRALDFFKNLPLNEDERHIAGDLVREVRDRLTFLVDVGLDYLNLARGTPTLSGGESQRIRLASQIGSGLTGVVYVLDEPTIGLHPRDNGRLLGALRHLRDLGNTLVLVEHDREVIEAADNLVDFGPGSGEGGGRITAAGPPEKVRSSNKSLTGSYLSGKAAIPVPTNRRPADVESSVPAVVVKGAHQHNLRNIDVRFPLGVVTAVTGVSGSGKSSLVEDILWKAAARAKHRAQVTPGAHEAIEGLEHVDKVISVDQSPLGSTPTSTPATYAGAFDLIRELFAKLPEAKVRGYTARRFSFNQPGGRCEACEGAGQKRIEMHFLPDVWITCDACNGARYTPETLAVRFHGKSIADVLAMSVDAALELFANVPKIRRILQTLSDVGLGYVSLGQSAATLSGGEAQRVKLAAELARPDTGKTLYILDEPTTGLHFDDVRKLLDVLHRLADLGNTVVVIEHNLDVIKTADWIIDLGPEAGLGGGDLVAEGTPEAVVAAGRGHTARFLKPVLVAGPPAERPRFDPKAWKKAVGIRGAGFGVREGEKNGPPRSPIPDPRCEGPLGARRPQVAHPGPRRRQRPPGALGRAHPRDDRRPGRVDGEGRLRTDRVVPARRGADQGRRRDPGRLPVLPRDHVIGMGGHAAVLRPQGHLPGGRGGEAARAGAVPPGGAARAQRPAAIADQRPRPVSGDRHRRPRPGRLRDRRLRHLPQEGRRRLPGHRPEGQAQDGQRADGVSGSSADCQSAKASFCCWSSHVTFFPLRRAAFPMWAARAAATPTRMGALGSFRLRMHSSQLRRWSEVPSCSDSTVILGSGRHRRSARLNFGQPRPRSSS